VSITTDLAGAIANATFSEHYSQIPTVRPHSTRSGHSRTLINPTALDALEAVSSFVETDKTFEEFKRKLEERRSIATTPPTKLSLPTAPSVHDITVQRDWAKTRRDASGLDAIEIVSHVSVNLEDLSEKDQAKMKDGLASLQSWAGLMGRHQSK